MVVGCDALTDSDLRESDLLSDGGPTNPDFPGSIGGTTLAAFPTPQAVWGEIPIRASSNTFLYFVSFFFL